MIRVVFLCLTMNKFTAHYFASKVASTKSKKKDGVNYGAPLSAALLAGGAGSLYAGNKMFTPEDEALVRQAPGFAEAINRAPADQQAEMNVDHMTQASRAKIYGHPVEEGMKVLRSLPSLLIGGSKNKWKNDSGLHYQNFAKGRISAYREEVPQGFGYDSIANKQVYDPLPSDVPANEAVSRYDSQVGSVAKGLGISPDIDKMTPDEQERVFGVLKHHMARPLEEGGDPQLSETLKRVETAEGPMLARNASGYAKTTNAVLGLRDGMRIAGGAAATVGGSALAWWLWRNHQKKKHEEQGLGSPEPVQFNLPIGGAQLKLAGALAGAFYPL
jgi:hypothetical protein